MQRGAAEVVGEFVRRYFREHWVDFKRQDAIELIKTLWTESPATYRGQWYQLDGAVGRRHDPAIPIMVGTNGPKALKVVARLGDTSHLGAE